MLGLDIPASWIELIGWTLIHSLWQISLVALALAGVIRLLAQRSPQLRYTVACGGLMLALALPALTAWVQDPLLSNESPTPAPLLTHDSGAAIQISPSLTASQVHSQLSVPWHLRLIDRLESFMPMAVTLWGVGVLAMSFWYAGGLLRMRRWRTVSVPADAACWQERLQHLARKLGIMAHVRLVFLPSLMSPAVLGWIKPTILFPLSTLTCLSTEEIETLLLHELAHIRRFDYLVNLMQIVTEILGFYHPALWWINRCIRVERELCCDEIVSDLCHDRVTYARTLVSLERLRLRIPQPALGATSQLTARIHRLLGIEASRKPQCGMAVALVTVAIMGLLVGLPLWAHPTGAAQVWEDLFDGSSLKGWQPCGPGKGIFLAKAGCVVGTAQQKEAIFLRSEATYSDFELQFEVSIDPNLNAGVQIRSHLYEQDTPAPWIPKPGKTPRVYKAGRVYGYQVEITGEGNKTSGSIWDEARRVTWLTDTSKDPIASQAWQDNQWNHYRVLCQGDRIQTWVNGVPCSDLHDPVTREGFIALQAYNRSKHPTLCVRWRNLRIRKL